MSDAARPLDEAYDLIERGEADAARDLLDDVRSDYTEDPDYWWVYAHATDDPDEGRDALQKVQELNPNYSGLDNLSKQIRMQTSPTVDAVERLPASSEQDTLPPDDEFDDFEDFAAELETARQAESQSRLGWLLGIAAIVVIGLVLGILALSGGGDDSEAPATDVAQVDMTEVPTAASIDNAGDDTVTEAVSETTSEVISEESTSDATSEDTTDAEDETVVEEATDDVTETTSEAAEAYANLIDQMSDFEVPTGGIQTQTTTLDSTLVVTTCALPGPTSSEAIVGIIDTLVAQIDALEEDINAIGIAITDCETDTVRRLVGIERNTLDAYATGDLTIQDVQRQLRPLN